MSREAEELLRQASELGLIGRFQLEAALQSAHVHRRMTGENNWPEVVRLYEALFGISGSPVVAINRAVAIGELRGADAGLKALEEVAADARVKQYQPYWAARADLLAKSGATSEANEAYKMAIGLERDPAVRRFLQNRQVAAAES
jgi:RNA polymerase sigma-70 factor (ECF subfamily)